MNSDNIDRMYKLKNEKEYVENIVKVWNKYGVQHTITFGDKVKALLKSVYNNERREFVMPPYMENKIKELLEKEIELIDLEIDSLCPKESISLEKEFNKEVADYYNKRLYESDLVSGREFIGFTKKFNEYSEKTYYTFEGEKFRENRAFTEIYFKNGYTGNLCKVSETYLIDRTDKNLIKWFNVYGIMLVINKNDEGTYYTTYDLRSRRLDEWVKLNESV